MNLLKDFIFNSLVSCLVLILINPVFAAEIRTIQKNEFAYYDGLLIDLPAAQEAIEQLRDAESLKAVNETLRGQVDALKKQLEEANKAIEQLAEADRKREEALIRADEREKIREEIERKLVQAIKLNQIAFDNMEKAAKHSEEALVNANKHIQSLEKQRTLTSLLGPLGLIVGVFTGAFVSP